MARELFMETLVILMKTFHTFLWLLFLISLMACNQTEKTAKSTLPPAPIADKADTLLQEHGKQRSDPYFWMRLSDNQKNATSPDAHTQKVLDYLTDENSYTDDVLAHTNNFQQALYDEMVGRIKETDESVPYKDNGFLVLY